MEIDPIPLGFPTDATFELQSPPTTGERTHYARDKWPLGPWHEETFDKVVWVDPATGLDCMANRGPMGNWCGYVGVPPSHPWHNIPYNGCINRHPPETMEAKEAKALDWLKKAQETFDADPSDTHKSALEIAKLSAKPWLEDDRTSFWCNHETWTCTGWGEEATCKTPEAIIDVHGGLTYSRDCSGVLCHVPKEGRPDDVYWYGFDCGHSMDLVPGMLASSKQMAEMGHDIFTEHLEYDPTTGTSNRFGMSNVYRRIPYVKAEVESLAQQLKAVQNGVS